jgi:hypothetical protein
MTLKPIDCWPISPIKPTKKVVIALKFWVLPQCAYVNTYVPTSRNGKQFCTYVGTYTGAFKRIESTLKSQIARLVVDRFWI